MFPSDNLYAEVQTYGVFLVLRIIARPCVDQSVAKGFEGLLDCWDCDESRQTVAGALLCDCRGVLALWSKQPQIIDVGPEPADMLFEFIF